MVTRKYSLQITAVAAALLLAIGYDGFRLIQDQRFNDSLTDNNATSTAGPEDAYRQFNKAYALSERQDFKAAVKAYASIDARPQSPLQMDIKFNLANLYFREAQRLRDTGDNDLAMPLIELAKQNYREILRADSAYWDAKHNLELALIVAPETDPVDALGERNPERSPRALTKIRSRKALP